MQPQVSTKLKLPQVLQKYIFKPVGINNERRVMFAKQSNNGLFKMFVYLQIVAFGKSNIGIERIEILNFSSNSHCLM